MALKKYEVITQVDMEDDGNVADNNCAKENNSNNNSSAAKNKAVFKLTLQSKSGDVFFAINSTPISLELLVFWSQNCDTAGNCVQ